MIQPELDYLLQCEKRIIEFFYFENLSKYIHIYHSCFIPEGVAEVSQIFLRDTHVLVSDDNTADVTGGKLKAVLLQSISGVSVSNPLVAFYDIHGRQREVLFFYFVPDTTRDLSTATPYCEALLSRFRLTAMVRYIEKLYCERFYCEVLLLQCYDTFES
jgi:hypothetical protein